MVGARRYWLIVIAVTALVGAAGCGGGDDDAVDVGEDSTVPTDEESTDGSDLDEDDAAAVFADEDCAFFLEALASNPLAGGGGSADSLDFAELGNAFDDIAKKAPDDLKDDFAFLGEFYVEYGPTMQRLIAAEGQPDPELIQEMTEIGQKIDQAKLGEASTAISTYFQEECGGPEVTATTGG